ncbi:Armadillo [Dillenia turbinata]|uniref:Armadillo n=1 Tax=Dillenia turbinata TaxID=194707 RepID=A0AAN8ZE80_9MAGN
MALTIPTQFKFNLKIPGLQNQLSYTHLETPSVRTRKPRTETSSSFHAYALNPISKSSRGSFLLRVSSDGGGAVDATPQHSSIPSETEGSESSSPSSQDSYVALFVRMLGLDNDPLDREQAIVALWKYSLGGKHYVDTIIQFRGCINLAVNLLKSKSSSACEAAAGLLRTISSVNLYRDLVADSGAIEEITGLLNQSSLASEVKEQSLCTLWNLSVDEKLREKIANSELLPLLIKFLDDEDMKVKEAAGGVLANLALSQSLHNIMVEAGIIPKLAELLKIDVEGSGVIRKEARNALLELAKDEYHRILVIEEGLVLVPLIGANAYKSFKPTLYSWPSLPDGTQFEQSSSASSRYGASELLLGLNMDGNNINIEEAKMDAVIGRTQQQFLARIGAIELENEGNSPSESLTESRFTLLPWRDGVARLVLILGLEDESAIARAANSIADASINEHMRISFREAGAVKHLVQLLDNNNHAIRLAVIRALEKLSVSNIVCQTMEAEGVLYPLITILKQSGISESMMEKTLDILARVLDRTQEMKSKFYIGPVNGSKKGWNARESPEVDAEQAKSVTDLPTQKSISRQNTMDLAVIGRLIEILWTSSPNLQRKAASVLEFMTMVEPCIDTIISAGIESGLDAVFRPKILNEESDLDGLQSEMHAVELEEAGLAISAASRLLTKLLEFEQFRISINASHLMKLLRKILMSNMPLENKGWVAASLVRLSSVSAPNIDFENPINLEVTLYETIPRLIEQIEDSFSPEAQEAAVIELNRIVSEGLVDSTRAVAAQGGISPLVKLVEEGSDRAVEASLSILYNLSMDDENHAAILAAGAVPALRRLVLSQRPQWMRALRLLRTLPT